LPPAFASGGKNNFYFFNCPLDGKQFTKYLISALFYFRCAIGDYYGNLSKLKSIVTVRTVPCTPLHGIGDDEVMASGHLAFASLRSMLNMRHWRIAPLAHSTPRRMRL
uniref:hypothetical protein n=1 Tax=Faecalicatena contorta TaxID=39482 RepID=UPI00359CA16B